MSLPFLKPATGIGREAVAASDAGGTTDPEAHSTSAPPNRLFELLIAEGKSAAQALDQVRDRRCQGIFMMQGKIPNPETTRLEKLQQHEQCAALLQLLQHAPSTPGAAGTAGEKPLNASGYDHVVIVPDADADGLHSAILLIALFRKHLPAWPASGRLHLFRTPLARIDHSHSHDNEDIDDTPTQRYLDTAPDIRHWLEARPATPVEAKIDSRAPSLTHFKGLAAINTDELAGLIPYPLHSNQRCMRLHSTG